MATNSCDTKKHKFSSSHFSNKIIERLCKNKNQPIGLYAKGLYNELVKTTPYDIDLESKPYDNDTSSDVRGSHYKRLGCEESRPLITTTQQMLEEGIVKQDVPKDKKNFLSYYTYHDVAKDQNDQKNCSNVYVSDYVTTMQNSYRPAHGYRMERLSVPQTPLFNRKFKQENPRTSDFKFFDEDHLHEINLLRKYKVDRNVSYNFMTGMLSNGEEPLPSSYT